MTGRPTNDDMASVLRDALEDAASNVTISPDALGDIRRRIAARRIRWLSLPAFRGRGATMISLSTAFAASVAALAIGVGSCSPSPHASPNPAAGPTITSGPTAASTSTTRPTAPPPTSGGGGGGQTPTANVPIYYIGANDKLYREFHSIPVGNGLPAAQVKAAITQMLDGRTALDKDYASQWPASASVRSASVAGGIATVDLHGATLNGFDPAGNRAALQQLIWTATAFPGATGVKLLFDGRPRATLWASKLPVAGILHRGPAVDVLAPVWVIDPQQDAVSGRSVTVHLAGIVFEGSIQMRVRSATGVVLQTKTVQLSAGAPAQGTATVNLSLAPGKYTIEAYFFSMATSCDCPMGIDQHTFTVR